MPTLVVLRHGESTWNAENRFTGWTDVDLSPAGEDEARSAGKLLATETEVHIDVVHTSVLTRAVRTANLALEEMGLTYLPVRRHWRLNERHYGALQGGNKKEATVTFGAEQVRLWRRSYATPPPPLELDDPRHPVHDPRYRDVPPSALPATECLADVVVRVVPYWDDVLAPELLRGTTPFVVAHGNSIRAFTMFLEHISEDDIVGLEIPTGWPRIITLDDRLNFVEGRYLGDPAAVAAAAAAVAAQAGPGPA
ncbi:MAG: 2,3-diphosphoglycerate-dependent phosphoglycerate mutase [Acidimicrobiales bacterium]